MSTDTFGIFTTADLIEALEGRDRAIETEARQNAPRFWEELSRHGIKAATLTFACCAETFEPGGVYFLKEGAGHIEEDRELQKKTMPWTYHVFDGPVTGVALREGVIQ